MFLKNIVLKISYKIGKSFSFILEIFNINNFNIFIRKEAIPNLKHCVSICTYALSIVWI